MKTSRIAVLIVLAFTLCGCVFGNLITLDFETDDYGTDLINGQIVDPTVDSSNNEFGNYVDISSVVLGSGSGHIGATIFDSTPGVNSSDKDLQVGLGNVLILQNSRYSNTAADSTHGDYYTRPDDEADGRDYGEFVFEFVNPVELSTVDLIDIDDGVEVELLLFDTDNNLRKYHVASNFTYDIYSDAPGVAGYNTFDLTTLLDQTGEAGGIGTIVQNDTLFDPTQVTKLGIVIDGSGAIDNLAFIVPEPVTVVLLGIGAMLLRKPKKN